MKKALTVIISLIVLAGLVFLIVRGAQVSAENKSKLDSFAQCLDEAGATFYGAFWCPHCQDQKATLKNSEFTPYVECSTATRGQTEECAAASIESYPTWEFADETRLLGAQSLETLGVRTGCVAPELIGLFPL